MIARRRKGKLATSILPSKDGAKFHLRKARKSRGYSRTAGFARVLQRGFLFAASFLCVGVVYYFHPDWIRTFLNGPDITAIVREHRLASGGVKHHEPTARRWETSDIATGFTVGQNEALEEMRRKFDLGLEEKKITPCSVKNDCLEMSQWADFISKLRGTTGESVVVRNTLPFHRYVCGHLIWGSGGTLQIDQAILKKCLNEGQPYVFSSRPPSITGKGTKPVDLIWNNWVDLVYEQKALHFERFKCSVPCRRIGQISLMNVIAVKGTRWEMLSTMEGEQYYSEAKYHKGSHQNDQFYALPTFKSEIPMPYFSWAEYKIQSKSVDFDKVIKGASFLANNCDSASKRELIVEDLMKSSLRVDSLSSCLNNVSPPKGVDMSNKTAIQELYLFHLAFENQLSEDYITEKLWGTLASGTLPVYFVRRNFVRHNPFFRFRI